VTRSSKFMFIGRLFLWAFFFNHSISPFWGGGYFFHGKCYNTYINFDKKGCATFFGRFFHKRIRSPCSQVQGCQMVCFQTKNFTVGKFWRVLLWKILVYFMTIWSILQPLEIFNGHLVYFVVI
jgi:hypothetical protein